jgi:hypothetical protein
VSAVEGFDADVFQRLAFRADFATDRTTPIWKFEKEPGWGLSLSSNGKSIVYLQREFAESDIMY